MALGSFNVSLVGGAVCTVASWYLKEYCQVEVPQEVQGAAQAIFTSLLIAFWWFVEILLRRFKIEVPDDDGNVVNIKPKPPQ